MYNVKQLHHCECIMHCTAYTHDFHPISKKSLTVGFKCEHLKTVSYNVGFRIKYPDSITRTLMYLSCLHQDPESYLDDPVGGVLIVRGHVHLDHDGSVVNGSG